MQAVKQQWSKQKRLDSFKYYLQHGFKDKDELYDYCLHVLGVHLPNGQVCENHIDPCTAVYENHMELVDDSLFWACRGGGKTYDLAILNVLDASFRPNIEISHVAAQRFQSRQGLKFTKDLFKVEPFNQLLTRDIQELNELKNGSSIEILTGSRAGCNSKHPAKSRFDEIDLVNDASILEEFYCMGASKSCPDCMNESPDVVKACARCRGSGELTHTQVTLASTRKTMSGLMQSILRDIEKGEKKIKIYEWCIWEVAQRCYDSCSTCPLTNLGCTGQCKMARGFKTKSDIIKTAQRVSRSTWESQFLNMKPSTEGLVYPDFDKRIHVAPLAYDPNLPCITAMDFGTSDPFICLWIQHDAKNDFLYVIDELQMNYSASRAYYDAVCKRESTMKYKVQRRFGDLRALSWITEFAALGMKVIGVPGKIEDGIQELRRRFKPALGVSNILIDGHRCNHLIDEVERYEHLQLRHTGEYLVGKVNPEQQDHCVDALRYGAYALKRLGIGTSGAYIMRERNDLPEYARYGNSSGFREADKLDLVPSRYN